MSDITLTKDAKYLMSLIYKEYRLREKQEGFSRSDVLFESMQEIDLSKEWKLDYLKDLCVELHKNELISYEDFIVGPSLIKITDKGLLFMDQRIKNPIKKIVIFIIKLISSLVGFVIVLIKLQGFFFR